MNTIKPIILVIAAGSLAHTVYASTPAASPRPTMSGSPTAHIFYNLATGEKVATSLNAPALRDITYPGETVWVADNDAPCAAFGQSGGTSVILDNPNDYFGTGAAPKTGIMMLDWGDVPADTVIDCVQFAYGTAIEDTDSNSDGTGDGVDGFGATWSFYDGANGFGEVCNLVNGLISFTLTNLPGQLDGPGGFSTYLITVDLDDDSENPLSFEIGDTDSDQQSASTHNPNFFGLDSDSDGIPDNDVDENGLADFGYAIRYIQPGSIDIDNADGDNDPATGIDGDPLRQDATAVPLAHYRGTTIEIDNGDGTNSYEIIPSDGPNAYGAEDVWDEYDSAGFYDASYWMGGFTCDDPDDGTVNPFGQIAITMYGPSSFVDCGDYTGDGILDIFDVFAYLDLFNAGDLAADYTGDGILDVFDVFGFLDVFNTGCR